MAVRTKTSGVTRADRDQIEQMLDRWVELSLKRDYDALLDEICTDDVTLMPPDHPVCKGRDQALAYLNGYPEIEAFTADVTSIQGLGDQALVEGTFDITVDDGGKSVNAVGKWLGAYRKAADGWKMTHDAWNNDAPVG